MHVSFFWHWWTKPDTLLWLLALSVSSALLFGRFGKNCVFTKFNSKLTIHHITLIRTTHRPKYVIMTCDLIFNFECSCTNNDYDVRSGFLLCSFGDVFFLFISGNVQFVSFFHWWGARKITFILFIFILSQLGSNHLKISTQLILRRPYTNKKV